MKLLVFLGMLLVAMFITVCVFFYALGGFVWQEYVAVWIHRNTYKFKEWWQRVQRRWAKRSKLIWHMVNVWWEDRGGDVGALVLIVSIILFTSVCLIVFYPPHLLAPRGY